MVSLETGQSACPGENITFSCTVNGSQSLSWASDEYIGTGGFLLEFSNHSKKGVPKYGIVNPDTFAVLTDVISIGETFLLQSELYIIVSNQSSTVYCLTTEPESSYRRSIDFDVLTEDGKFIVHARQSSIN